MEIIWKNIKEFERYKVNNYGEVISLIGNIKKLKPWMNKYGYLGYKLYRGRDNYKWKAEHHLVLESFVRERTGNEQCNHKDGNKINNYISNLEWVTPKENTNHAIKHKLRCNKGKNHYLYGKKLPLKTKLAISENNRKLNNNQLNQVYNLINLGYNDYKIAEIFKVSQPTIWRIRNKKVKYSK